MNKQIIILFFSAIPILAFATGEVPAPIEGSPAKSFYMEIVPGEMKAFSFETEKTTYLCNDRLAVKSFESSEKLPSTDTDRHVNVKVLNLHVNKLVTGCLNKGPGKKLTATYNTPKSNKMIHVYITTDDDIKVKF